MNQIDKKIRVNEGFVERFILRDSSDLTLSLT